MASPARENLKQTLLLALVAVCVLLVGLTWADNLDDRVTSQTGFVRGTAPVLATLAPTASPRPALTALPPSVGPSGTPTAGPTPTEDMSEVH